MKISFPYEFTYLYGFSLNDGSDRDIDIDAHVRSGDYFSTLATILDDLTDKLPSNSDEVLRLERCVRDLLYVDGKYKIVAKNETESLL